MYKFQDSWKNVLIVRGEYFATHRSCGLRRKTTFDTVLYEEIFFELFLYDV